VKGWGRVSIVVVVLVLLLGVDVSVDLHRRTPWWLAELGVLFVVYPSVSGIKVFLNPGSEVSW
jgi:hypothetical protein